MVSWTYVTPFACSPVQFSPTAPPQVLCHKPMWKALISAWYNIVSALVILFILGGIVAFYLYRKRFASLSRRKVGVVNLPRDGDEAERVPLGSERVELQTLAAEQGRRKGKGKGRAVEEDDYEEEVNKGTTVFELGDED